MGVCPGLFKTTTILIIVRDSSIRTFLLFINFSVLFFCLCVVAADGFCHSAFLVHKLRAGPGLCYGV